VNIGVLLTKNAFEHDVYVRKGPDFSSQG
jgi:hypothetical protein